MTTQVTAVRSTRARRGRTPRGLRPHIGLFGRRNAGKSSLINALAGQTVSIVSPSPGTTTDPVERPMELQPLGPVVLVDTAGLDDQGDLGGLRVAATKAVVDRVDLALVLVPADQGWGRVEQALVDDLTSRAVPVIAVVSKADLGALDPGVEEEIRRKVTRLVTCSAVAGLVDEVRRAIVEVVPPRLVDQPSILGDLVPPGRFAVLVVPIDKEAPKGRLIMPQVQSIRDLLDSDAWCVVVKERELAAALASFREPPSLVVTDSQAFLKVAADTPRDVPMTSFSILFARYKGDLVELVRGACAIDRLGPGDRVLIAEACAHHPISEDIGRVKIPRWLRQYVGASLEIDVVAGRGFPDDPSGYSLVIHCGACVWNRRSMMSRIQLCKAHGVPITNYGLAIAWSLGLFDRALEPFPAAREEYLASTREVLP